MPDLVKRANLPAGTALAIYEEIKPNMLEKVEDLDKPLEHVLEELMDGDILVFQKKTADANYRYGWGKLLHRINVCVEDFKFINLF